MSALIPYFGSQLSANVAASRLSTLTSDQSTANAANKLLGSIKLLPASVNIQQLSIAKSYFVSMGTPSTVAETMALLLIDVAKSQNTSVMKIIEQAKSNTGILFGADTYSVLNLLRQTITQIGIATPISNKNSYTSRSILF